MLRRTGFWIAAGVAAAALAIAVVALFPHAFPVVTLDVKMSRPEALAQARALAERHGWGPAGARDAATFELDTDVRDFVELEGGGTDAFRGMMAGDDFAPYTWRVRLFKEGDAHQTRIWFRPSGAAFGFRETFAETEPGAKLGKDEARAVADEGARAWGVDLSEWTLIEHEVDDNPPERTDHVIEYERIGMRVGEAGEYRLRLRVAGDRFAGLEPYVRIPEAFARRYEKMRSANNAIAIVASLVAMGLYLAVGGLVGLFVLLRARQLIWRPAFAWGFFIAFLQVLAALNGWPLIWMDYDTALSSGTFVMQQLAQLAAVFLGFGLLLGISFMIAEGLTRRAFPSHPQLWRLWSKDVAPTRAVLGRTLAGYLLVPLALSYVVAFYFLAHRGLGWWSPSEALTDPDVLATWFPWLTPIAVSAQAGFWEECLFRAIPIAGAALVGQRIGWRRTFIAGALILQALVFGAGHANYPNQPSYARVVELIVPALAFALIYIGFGLLTAIVLHYVFDAVLFALPLFTSSAEGAWIHQALVIVFILAPLAVVMARRWRAGAWSDLPEGARNAAWSPPERQAAEEPAPPPARPALSPRPAGIVAVLGLAGALAWGVSARWTTESPPLIRSRAGAIAEAKEALAERGVDAGAPWKLMIAAEPGLYQVHEFAWRELDRAVFRDLVGKFLAAPRWEVRLARFEGDVAERAEEWRVRVAGDGSWITVVHRLPEAREGASLSEQEARDLALGTIRGRFGLEPGEVEEIEVSPRKRPARMDWTVTFGSRREPLLAQGDRRATVQIAGDEVTDAYKWVHVPEKWERDERDRSGRLAIARISGGVGIALVILGGAVAGVVSWVRRRFAVRAFLLTWALVGVLGLIGLALAWPQHVVEFSTAQAWALQAGLVIGATSAAMILGGGVLGLLAGFVHGRSVERDAPGIPAWLRVVAGFGLGFVAAGIVAVARALLPSLGPPWGSVEPAGQLVPLLAEIVSPLIGLIGMTLLALVVVAALDRLTAGFTRRRVASAAGAVVLGLVISGMADPDSLTGWLVGGACAGLLLLLAYAFVLRFDSSLVPLAVAALLVTGRIVEGVQAAHPVALPGALVSAALVAGAAVAWHRALARRADA